MSVEKGLTAFAGLMILLSVAMMVWIDSLFVWLIVFIGANLLQQSFTGLCPASRFMNRVLKMKWEKQLAQEALDCEQSCLETTNNKSRAVF